MESKHALLRSARELVHQRLREQSAGSALAALCPELSSDAALARLASDDLLLLIEARATAPEAARLSDAGFVRASWGAVPPGMLSPKRRTTYAHAPPPESPAARAAELSALAAAGEWDVVEVLIDNRGILLTAFFSDVILLAAALAAGVGGARRVAAALPVPAAALLAAEGAAEGAMRQSPSADGFVLEAEPASAPTPADEPARAPTPSHSESDTDGESTPIPEVADDS